MISIPTNPSIVIGAGPNGVDYYQALSRKPYRQLFRVALNGAATNRKWTARMFGDQNCYRYDYFYKKRPGEMRLGPGSCGDDFDEYVHPQYLTPGATVVGMTLKWLQSWNCNHVILCGVDMFGHHWDGTDSGQSGVWKQLAALQAVIDELSSSGMTIQTLSESKLNIARIDIHAKELRTVTG